MVDTQQCALFIGFFVALDIGRVLQEYITYHKLLIIKGKIVGNILLCDFGNYLLSKMLIKMRINPVTRSSGESESDRI